MTQPLGPKESVPAPPAPAPPSGRRKWGRGLAVTIAAVVVGGAGAGVGMATASTKSTSDGTTMGASGGERSGHNSMGKKSEGHNSKGHKHGGGMPAGKKLDPARQAWAHKYGMDRATMPDLPDVGAASPQQQAAAKDLLVRTEAATAKYADPATARAAGYDLQASLTRAENKKPGLAKALERADSATPAMSGRMTMLHVGKKANKADGKVLDPTAPETLMYGYEGHGQWKLVGVMYVAGESYPQAPPDPGGPISRWHYHDKSGGQGLMMHIFFVPGNDLAHAYATDMGS